MVLTLTCDQLLVNFDVDAEHLCQLSWKSEYYFSRNDDGVTNQPTNNHRQITAVHHGRGNKIAKKLYCASEVIVDIAQQLCPINW